MRALARLRLRRQHHGRHRRARASSPTAAGVLAKRLKAVTDKPVLVGFGVSTPEHAVELSAEADGVVIASVLMRKLLDGGGAEDVGALVAGIRAALDAA